MRAAILTFGGFVMLAHSLLAVVGEARLQIESRLGSGVPNGRAERIYKKGDFTIEVLFEKDISVLEIVFKTPKRPYVSPLEGEFSPAAEAAGSEFLRNKVLTKGEIEGLLKVYGGGKEWTKSDIRDTWTRSGAAVVAVYENHQPYQGPEQERANASAIGLPSERDWEQTESITFTDVAFAQAESERRKAAEQLADEKQRSADAQRVAGMLGDSPAPQRPIVIQRGPIANDVAASQKRALAKHPELGQAGSAFNKRFLERYQRMQAEKSNALQESNWPELLADDCATNP